MRVLAQSSQARTNGRASHVVAIREGWPVSRGGHRRAGRSDRRGAGSDRGGRGDSRRDRLRGRALGQRERAVRRRLVRADQQRHGPCDDHRLEDGRQLATRSLSPSRSTESRPCSRVSRRSSSKVPRRPRTAFTTAWFGASPPSGFLIGFYSGSGVGLSTTSDAVNIYDSTDNLVAGVTFGASDAVTPFQSFDNAAGDQRCDLDLEHRGDQRRLRRGQRRGRDRLARDDRCSGADRARGAVRDHPARPVPSSPWAPGWP